MPTSTHCQRVLAHFREHSALPTTRYGHAYAGLVALRRQRDEGLLSADDAVALAETGQWWVRMRTAHNRGVKPIQLAQLAERVELVEEYVQKAGRLPRMTSPAGRALRYLRARVQYIPDPLILRLDALETGWRFHYHRSDEQFLDTLEALVRWREEYPRRWPRAMNSSFSEGRFYTWLRGHRTDCQDSWRLQMLDVRLPGWRDSGDRLAPPRVAPPYNAILAEAV